MEKRTERGEGEVSPCDQMNETRVGPWKWTIFHTRERSTSVWLPDNILPRPDYVKKTPLPAGSGDYKKRQ